MVRYYWLINSNKSKVRRFIEKKLIEDQFNKLFIHREWKDSWILRVRISSMAKYRKI